MEDYAGGDQQVWFREERSDGWGAWSRKVAAWRIVAPLFNNFYRIEGSLRSEHGQRAPQRQTHSRGGRMPQLKSVNRPRVGVIVGIRVHMGSVRPRWTNRGKVEMVEMRVQHRRTLMIGSRMDVLKRGKQECQQKCQACFDGQRATHQ